MIWSNIDTFLNFTIIHFSLIKSTQLPSILNSKSTTQQTRGLILKKKLKNSIVAIILFLLTIGLALGAGTYRNIVSAEKAQFQAKIPAKHSSPIVLDLAKQSIPKKLAQPGLVSLSTGHGPMGITNDSNKELVIQVKFKDFPSKVELEMPGVQYDEKTYILKQPLKPKQLFKMDITLEVPKEYRNKLIGFSGEIQFLNHKDNTILSSIPVHVVNSKYGDPYKKLNIDPNSFGKGSWGGKGKGEGMGKGSSGSKQNEKNDGNNANKENKNDDGNDNAKSKDDEPCH
jgi:hypothetical protein